MRAKANGNSVRLAAVADLHCTRTSQGMLRGLLEQMAENADVLLLCGDLTDYGHPEEAQVLAGELKVVAGTPVVAVLGNHDFESGQQDEVKAVLSEAGVRVLDGDSCVFHDIGFAGVKGFFGGFDGRMLQAWGEPITKQIVREVMDEALKLESALARLETSRRVVLLHFSPIQDTVEGEPIDIFPFLGSSRLEEPLHRYPITAVFHGHAHHGSPEGRTAEGVPVYNVAMPLLKRIAPDQPAFRIVNVKVDHD